jgi:hypothetical protein
MMENEGVRIVDVDNNDAMARIFADRFLKTDLA